MTKRFSTTTTAIILSMFVYEALARKDTAMTHSLSTVKKAIVFNENQVKASPPAFDGVTLKSFLHPRPEFNDSFSSHQLGSPDVQYSFGLFVIEKGKRWPLTRFSITEVNYILEGEAEFEIEGEKLYVKKGDIIYIPPKHARSIRVIGDQNLKFLSIVDPAWLPEYEEVL